jgi:hypothetical protein
MHRALTNGRVNGRGPSTQMKYDVEREIEERWYPVAGPTDSGSAAQAVARAALTEGVYRVRPAHRGGERYELFRVPAWGAPISLGTA